MYSGRGRLRRSWPRPKKVDAAAILCSELNGRDLPSLGYEPYGRESGWSAIQPRLAWAASHFRDGRWEYEPIAAMFGSEIGYTVGLERTAALIGGDTSPTTQELRVTHVFRREADLWRIVHRHADPLMATKAPFPRDG